MTTTPTPIQVPTIRLLGEPGDFGWVVQAHGEIYTREYGWGGAFEAHIARIVAEFAQQHNVQRERGWIAELGGRRVGCVLCVCEDAETARLRILLVDPAARGHKIGARLVDTCMDFARSAGYRRMVLWTNHPLVAARHIYLERGFVLTKEEPHDSYDVPLIGQTYEITL